MSDTQRAPGAAASVAEVAEFLGTRPRTLITSHVNPDGDAVGSSLAALHALRTAGLEADYVQIGPIASVFSFLPGFDEIRRDRAGLRPAPEVLLVLDCAAADRIGPILDRMSSATTVVNVDHHVTNTRFGDMNLVDGESAATGEILFHLLRAMNARITSDVATCLYTAIVTDTGRFGYPATTPEVHAMAADLLRSGVRPADVHERLYRSRPEGLLRLTAALIQGMSTRFDGAFAWIEMTHDLCREAGISMTDASDMVDIPAGVQGVRVAALLRETSVPDRTKLSLRAKGRIAVDDIAVAHGGGGHPQAAGCTLPVGMAGAREIVLRAVEETLRRAR